MGRGDLSNAEWAIIGPLLPSERGRSARPGSDNRVVLNGMLYVLRAGCLWRDMHERYGKLDSIYVRFRRWAEQGVWDALLETLVELGLTDHWQHMIDSTTVRGHSQAAGAKGERLRGALVEAAALYEQGARPRRRSRTPSRLCHDGRPNLGLVQPSHSCWPYRSRDPRPCWPTRPCPGLDPGATTVTTSAQRFS